MNDAAFLHPQKYCGRIFSPVELTRIRTIVNEGRNRTAISRLVCQEFRWYKRDGGLKEMSCRVALLRMHRDGLITLPLPQRKNANGKISVQLTSATDPAHNVIYHNASHLRQNLCIKQVDNKALSRLWNEYIARYHYLGHAPLPGAQMRYIVYHNDVVLACLGFGAAAWSVKPRDSYIGWTKDLRQSNLHLVVNNARFLILPWVTCYNLASMVLSSVSKVLPASWEERYGYRPALLETFVETPRFHGTCYKAANWTNVGITKGRGKLDTQHNHALPQKEIFLFPLCKNFREVLMTDP